MLLLPAFLLLGLLIGSFLNVVIIRLRDAETLLGRSFCRSCKHTIRWYDNVPLISFILLRGSCRDCGEKISWQYPFVEGVTALVFLLIGWLYFSPEASATWLETCWLLGLAAILIALAAYDARHLEMPLSLLILGLGWTLLFLLVSFFWNGLPGILFWETRLGLGLLGGALIGFFFFILVFFSKETWMGWGDVWLGILAGLVIGLPLAFFVLTLSFALGALFGVGTLISHKKSLKSQIAFGPFLVSGLFLVLFLTRLFPELVRLFAY